MEIKVNKEEIELIEKELADFYEAPEKVQDRIIVINALLRKYLREEVESKVSINCMLRAIVVCEDYFKNLNEGEA